MVASNMGGRLQAWHHLRRQHDHGENGEKREKKRVLERGGRWARYSKQWWSLDFILSPVRSILLCFLSFMAIGEDIEGCRNVAMATGQPACRRRRRRPNRGLELAMSLKEERMRDFLGRADRKSVV